MDFHTIRIRSDVGGFDDEVLRFLNNGWILVNAQCVYANGHFYDIAYLRRCCINIQK